MEKRKQKYKIVNGKQTYLCTYPRCKEVAFYQAGIASLCMKHFNKRYGLQNNRPENHLTKLKADGILAKLIIFMRHARNVCIYCGGKFQSRRGLDWKQKDICSECGVEQ